MAHTSTAAGDTASGEAAPKYRFPNPIPLSAGVILERMLSLK